MLVQIYTCGASHKLLISVFHMPTGGIFRITSKHKLYIKSTFCSEMGIICQISFL